jgi:DNA mismatch repair ATPase MutS
MVSAIGGLLNYIKESSVNESDENFSCVQKIEDISFEGYLQLDIDTLQSLSIFKGKLIILD